MRKDGEGSLSHGGKVEVNYLGISGGEVVLWAKPFLQMQNGGSMGLR